MFRAFVHKPHVIHVTEIYEGPVRDICDWFDDSRTLIPSTDGLPSGGVTEIATRVFDFAKLARVAVYHAAIEFQTAFDGEEKRIEDRHCAVIQVRLKMSRPWISVVVNILRDRGYFLCRILPRWFTSHPNP